MYFCSFGGIFKEIDACRGCCMWMSLAGSLFGTWLTFLAYKDPERIGIDAVGHPDEAENAKVNLLVNCIVSFLAELQLSSFQPRDLHWNSSGLSLLS